MEWIVILLLTSIDFDDYRVIFFNCLKILNEGSSGAMFFQYLYDFCFP